MFSKFLAVALLFVSVSAFAQRSEQLGRPVYLHSCGGSVTLNEANNGDLSIQLHNVNTYRCPRLEVRDASSGRMIRSYEIQGTSYTLSRQMLSSLNSDCRLNFSIEGGAWREDGFTVYIPWCSSHGGGWGRVTYEWSNNGNCKKMIDGQYSGQNVADYYCAGLPGGNHQRITYEWSNAGNCKKMITGQYSGQNVADHYCRGNGGGHGGQRITYEWSNAGNCKKMINGRYSGENVAKHYCR
jgi:hypothetical protein